MNSNSFRQFRTNRHSISPGLEMAVVRRFVCHLKTSWPAQLIWNLLITFAACALAAAEQPARLPKTISSDGPSPSANVTPPVLDRNFFTVLKNSQMHNLASNASERSLSGESKPVDFSERHRRFSRAEGERLLKVAAGSQLLQLLSPALKDFATESPGNSSTELSSSSSAGLLASSTEVSSNSTEFLANSSTVLLSNSTELSANSTELLSNPSELFFNSTEIPFNYTELLSNFTKFLTNSSIEEFPNNSTESMVEESIKLLAKSCIDLQVNSFAAFLASSCAEIQASSSQNESANTSSELLTEVCTKFLSNSSEFLASSCTQRLAPKPDQTLPESAVTLPELAPFSKRFTNSSTESGVAEDRASAKREAPYGSWASPISSEVAVLAFDTVTERPQADRALGHIYWVEEVRSENGHGVLFQYDVEKKEIIRWTDQNTDVRTRVHEYGGGSFLVYNGTAFYASGDDHQIYKMEEPLGVPEKVTNSSSKRYTDFSYSPKTKRLYCVFEDHGPVEAGSRSEAVNGIAVIDLRSGKEEVMFSHADFFASPRVTEDGTRLAWIQWNHPLMPWDNTKLCAGKLSEKIASVIDMDTYLQQGSMMTPNWNQHNELLYVSDLSDWWNLYILNRDGAEMNLTPRPAEVGWPCWTLGTQAFDTNPAVGASEAAVIQGKELFIVDTRSVSRRVLNTGYSVYSRGLTYSNDGKKIYTVAGDGNRPLSVVEVDVETGSARALRDHPLPVSEAYVSVSEVITFPTTDEMFAYGHLYLPKNPDYEAPSTSLPPLLVRTHQGPTSAASTSINFNYQFFTSRGFAILDVDYRGSSGYGTAFRNLLKGKWGVYDLDDAVAGAKHLIENSVVDPEKIFIDGESAGGFTTMAAITFTDFFTAGASFYGISDLNILVKNTHKFESQYMYGLLGAETGPVYRERSAFYHAQNVSTPVIFFQGTEDKIVSVDQAKNMYSVVKNNSIPTALVLYEGEKHGFVEEQNLRHSLEAELYFFSCVSNFSLADITSDVTIDNLQTC